MLAYVWPRGNWSIKGRVLFAMALLVSAKVRWSSVKSYCISSNTFQLLNVCVPFLFKNVIDYFNEQSNGALNLDSPASTMITVGITLILACKSLLICVKCISIVLSDGLARTGSALFNELRNAVFAKVAQNGIRSIARSVFLHLHRLDLSFHLNRQTGALSKAIDRGTRYGAFVYVDNLVSFFSGLSFVLNALVFNVVPTIIEMSLVTGIFVSV